ncbi:MAG: AAA family ATPase [Candidatus Methanomethylophilus sp.]|jgi:predicted AAA+ superfamily ATPase|nr:AAA family ATPase [Methanomethylophilus sp.]
MDKNLSPPFRRKIYREMLEWKRGWSGRYALLIEGARRVGKTTIVKEFAAREYENSIYIDFNNPPEQIIPLFEHNSGNLDRFLSYLGALYKVEMHERRTLIIFDEVQNYPKARALIKYLVEDGRYDYIETGSLISLRKNVENITIPSEEMRIEMYPMDFEEFCWAGGDETTVPFIRKHFEEMVPLAPLHGEMMERYRTYMLVGGMPQAVAEYWNTKDFSNVEKVKRQILALYREDMGKIPVGNGTKARMIFDHIPSMLSFHRKTFSPSRVKKGSKRNAYADSVSWLEEAKICNICYVCADPDTMLNLTRGDEFKCYLLDTGLLVTLEIEERSSSGIYSSFIGGDLSINSGMFFENMVAQELRCSGHNLFYHEFYPSPCSKKPYEVDFILPADSGGIVPIEVKSGRISARHASLDAFVSKYQERVRRSYVVHSRDLRVDGDIVYIPIYMSMFL